MIDYSCREPEQPLLDHLERVEVDVRVNRISFLLFSQASSSLNAKG
jgi:hypothetical protein